MDEEIREKHMEIRKAGVEDIEAVVSMRLEFFDEIKPMAPGVREELAQSLRAFMKRHFAAGDMVALLGKQQGQLVATGLLNVTECPPKPYNISGRTGYICSIYTPPAHRHKGYARQIVGRLVQEARQMGLTRLDLTATDAGRPLYIELGFGPCHENYLELFLEGDIGNGDSQSNPQ